MIFRRDFPDAIPSKEQLRTVIANADDSQINSLILNLNGTFELRERPPFDIHKNDPTVIIRHETFAAGNDYVGLEAAQDVELIDELFCSSLVGWLNHLKFGQTQEYVGFSNRGNSEQIQSEIEHLREKWIPAY